MFAALRNLITELSGDETRPAFEEDDYRLAATALLVHAAGIDGSISDAERDKLQARLKLRFGLDDAAAVTLIERATEAEREAVDLYRFTSLLTRSLDEAGRRHIVELMWEVVYADGRVSEFEDNLIWRVADLLHVPSRDRIELRRRVAQRTAAGGGE
jgi:uncharacterized tellurite resistance protein B-like protein